MKPFQLSERAKERRRARDKRDGLKHLTHKDGLCGMEVAACCMECYADELKEMRIWAVEEVAPNLPPIPGEGWNSYWDRLSDILRAEYPSERTYGMYGDCWPEAAQAALAAARELHSVAS